MENCNRIEPLTTFFYLIGAYAICSFALTILFSNDQGHVPASAGGGHGKQTSGPNSRKPQVRDAKNFAHPRVFGYYFEDASTPRQAWRSPRRLPADTTKYYPTKRTVRWTLADEKGRKQLLNSVTFMNTDYRALNPYQESPECVPMHDWQTKSFPACNNVHQADLTDLSYDRNRLHRQVRIIAHGYFRDVWAIREYDGLTLQVLKTIRYEHEFTEWNLERHRMDAVVYERLTSSPRVMNIYGFCGHSALFEMAPGGDITDALFENDKKPSIEEKFDMAVQVAQAISDLHNFNGKVPAIAHADIMTNQFVLIDGVYKLSDFNRCTFLYWNTTSNAGNCPYKYGDYNAWVFRSPEEYYYDLQTEKIDVYSMGNIFYTLLMEKWPFDDLYEAEGTSAVRKQVRAGNRPPMNATLLTSQNPRIVALIKAMKMCYVHDWRDRATSKQVAEFLTDSLKKIKENEKNSSQ